MHVMLMLFLVAVLGGSAAEVSPCDGAALASARARTLAQDGQLNAVVSAEDLFLLMVCDSKPANEVERVAIAGLAVTHVRRSCRWEAATVPLCRFGSETFRPQLLTIDKCEASAFQCVVDVFVKRDVAAAQPQGEVPFGASGGGALGGLIQHLGGVGHYEITGTALQRYAEIASNASTQIGQSVLNVFQDASRDADFYEWEVPAAHAQLAFDAGTLELSQSSDAGKNAVKAWLQSNLRRRLLPACEKGDFRVASYWIGYSMHAVQDLVFHEGMSNPEHAYRDLYDMKVDVQDKFQMKLDTAVVATVVFLQELRTWLATNKHEVCLPRALAQPAAAPFATSELRKLHGHGWTMTTGEVIAFKTAGVKFKSLTNGGSDCNGSCDRYILWPKWVGWDTLKDSEYPDRVNQTIRDSIRVLFAAQ